MGEIFTAIAKYGIVPVIIGVILYLLILMYLKSSDRKKKTEEEKQKIIREEKEQERELQRMKQEQERDLLMLEKMKELIHPEHTVEEQKSDLKRNSFIVNQLNCLVDEGCDRAYMFTFHNGGQDVLGRGFLKMSMTQEAISEGVVPIMPKYLNIPRMLFPILYNQLNGKDYYNIDNVEDIKKSDPFTYQFLIEHNVHTAMFRVIKRQDGLVIGFIGMEYISKQCEDLKKAGKNIDKKVNRIIGAILGQDD